jgi:succinyl-CoA synthetase beta subunit
MIANGIQKACQTLDLKIPLVVRLQGTNMDEACQILNRSQMSIIIENDFEKATDRIISLVNY